MRKKILFFTNYILLLFCIFFFTSIFECVYAANNKSIYAGTSKVNITPGVPIPMSGYSGRKDNFKGVHDDLFARVIVFSDGEHKAAIIASDIIGYSHSLSEEIRRRIEQEAGISQEYILLTATHTHGGPSPRIYNSPSSDMIAYVDKLKEEIVNAVKEASGNLIPARIGAGTGECKMNINRRARRALGGIWLGYNPYGPCDHEVGVVRIDDLNGNTLAILINWPCHGTIMGSKNYQITGDWPGAAARYVEKQFNDKIIALVTAGASGDINPLLRVRDSSFKSSIEEVEMTGIYVGEEVVKVAKEINTSHTGLISALQRVVTLPGKKVPTPKFRDDGKYSFEPGPDVDIYLSVLKVGNIIFAGVSGEVMNEIGMKLKNQSPFVFTFMLTHCNGSSGYLVTDDSYSEGGYEVVSTKIMSGAEKAIIENLLDMINGL